MPCGRVANLYESGSCSMLSFRLNVLLEASPCAAGDEKPVLQGLFMISSHL